MENKANLTILVTGFGAFGTYKTNPSWEAVKCLPDLFKTREELSNVELIVIQIPVVYEYVASNMNILWEKHKPSIIVHVGVSCLANCLTLETQASSKGYVRPDIFNKCPKENHIDPVTLKTKCKIQDICKIINSTDEINCKAIISSDAGKYLCEYIYYHSLALEVPQVLFVHVPESNIYSSEQTAQGILKIILYLVDCATNDKNS